MELIISARNWIISWSYKYLLKPILFTQDPEKMHRLFISIGKLLGSNPLTRGITYLKFGYSKQESLSQEISGIKFANPVGLSAGFDKNAEMIKLMPALSFGFTEVGSITALACSGNSGERMQRIPETQSLWVNLGLNNAGTDVLSKRVKNSKSKIPVGINVAKTNCKETADTLTGLKDYLTTIKDFKDIGDYITLNISCPNAFGGQPFSNPDSYEMLLYEISKLRLSKPVFVKLSPDLTKKNLDQIISITQKYKVAGFICTNLTKNHYVRPGGGVSGKALEEKSNELIKYIYKKTKAKYIIIGVGGIFSANDAYKKIKLGASLVQLITGMIYEGPQLISQINHGLVKLLKADGFTNISEAVGKDNK